MHALRARQALSFQTITSCPLLLRLLAFLLVSVAIPFSSVAQLQFQWAKGIQALYDPNGSSSRGEEIFRSANGSLYLVGRSFFSQDFNPDAGVDSQYISTGTESPTNFVSRYNAATGAYSWTRRHPVVSGTPIFTDSGVIYFTGFFKGTIDFDPGPGVTSLTSTAVGVGTSGADMYLARYDTAYNLVWVKKIAQSDYANNRQIRRTFCDAQGNVYIACTSTSAMAFTGQTQPIGSAGGFLIKLNSAGTLLWAGTMTGSNSTALDDFAVDRQGNIIIGGITGGGPQQPATLTFMGTAGSLTIPVLPPYVDGFVAKYSLAGAILWARNISGDDHQRVYDVATDSVGNVFASGTIYGVSTFDSASLATSTFTAVASSAATMGSGFLVKYNPQGAYQWARQVSTTGETYCADIAIDHDGHAYVGGGFKGSITLNPGGANPAQYTSGSTKFDGILIKYNGATGQHLSSIRYAATAYTDVMGLHIDRFRNLYATGATTHTTNFNPGGAGGTVTYINNLPITNLGRTFLMKHIWSQSSTVENVPGSHPFNIYPNPTTGHLTIAGAEAGTAYTIHSILGKEARHGTISSSHQPLNLAALPGGVYLLTLTKKDGMRATIRIVRE